MEKDEVLTQKAINSIINEISTDSFIPITTQKLQTNHTKSSTQQKQNSDIIDTLINEMIAKYKYLSK